ncbi:KinB-signaling pathway activation protein [Brevibacillus fulvus]|uniref:KinB signaling pathway activation protein n=1 Tax=Brevibacillus fulvus TaxID=1125967 RepID=A0A938Y289_9BACL|nr:KinB-signaling pathway activation protein [Brevibacillus fulvus]MBM7591980.1 KinB signaling pathway activation protein [Brevibacillus fulvus]
MNLRKYGWLFGTTLLVGGIGGILAGFIVGRADLFDGGVGNFLIATFMNLLFGLSISVLTQMGFFAYMMLNYLAQSVFKSRGLWRNIQILLILFTFFDFVYLRYSLGVQGDSLWPYFVEPSVLLLVSVIAAYAKVRLTNPTAWVPTVFFLFVGTTIEWIPALRENAYSAIFMAVPLLFCNIWQVLHLQRLVKADPAS